ncbi:MAG: bifunctional riboflavin kinase/FAD synthetase [Chitinophagales bacterium]|nr:bifunctional riboflavin kinase/FAD synthetase [Chitinophagales bacterium]
MKIFKGIQQEFNFKNPVLTIGTYDGVHLGHQAIIQRINELAKERGGESVLLTFDPHPRIVLFPEKKMKLISTIDEKIRLFESFGLDNLIITPFSKDFASTEAKDYVKDVLVKYIKPSIIVIGYDHKFGNGRQGDIHLLRDLSEEFHYQVDEISAQTIDEISVSSTKVRKALMEADIKEANKLLAHPFMIEGVVVKGDQLGRTLGFPTANVEIGDDYKLIPPAGVYAVWVYIQGEKYKGALSIGHRPTIENNGNLRIEVYILDFDRNIYGEEIRLVFEDYIRADKKFDSIDLMTKQIHKDVEEVRRVLS